MMDSRTLYPTLCGRPEVGPPDDDFLVPLCAEVSDVAPSDGTEGRRHVAVRGV